MKTLSLETTKLLDKLYNLRGNDSVVLVEMDKQKEKNIVLPKLELVKERISKSLEELKIPSQYETLLGLYSAIKKSKHKYRLSLEECMTSPSFSSKDYKRKGIILYTF